jgi:hypothetical protein
MGPKAHLNDKPSWHLKAVDEMINSEHRVDPRRGMIAQSFDPTGYEQAL